MKVLAVFALLVAVCATVQAQVPSVGVYSVNAEISEAGVTNQFTFYRDDANTTLTITVLLSGTATYGVDYGFDSAALRPGLNSISFGVNVTNVNVNLFTIDDDIEESTETVTLEVQSSTRYNLITGDGVFTLNITDDDEPRAYYVYAATDFTSVDEDSGDSFIAVFAEQYGFLPISLTFTVSGTATLNQDYTVTGAEALGGGRFRAFNSDAGANVGFRPIADGIFEADETIQVSIDLSDLYTVFSRTIVFTILNDDLNTLPVVSIDFLSGGSAFLEDAGLTYSYSFYRDTDDLTSPLTVSFRVGGTAVYTATAATDYTVVSGAATFSATRGTVVIPAGSNSQSVVIRSKADAIPEDNETVEFTLIESVLYTLDSEYTSSSFLIINDDGLPVVTVATVGTTTVTEGAGQLSFRFTRVGPTSYPLDVYFSLTGTASYPADYVVSGAVVGMGTYVTIPINAASVDILVSPRSDVLLEPRESVIVLVESSWGSISYNIGTPDSATAFILDSPPALPVVALVGDEFINEGQTKSYRITRSGILTGDIVVVISFSGTATIKNDYTVSGGILTGNRLVITMPAGKSYALFSLAAIRDFILDVDETIIIDLVPQSRYIINPAGSTKTVLVNDPDTPPG